MYVGTEQEFKNGAFQDKLKGMSFDNGSIVIPSSDFGRVIKVVQVVNDFSTQIKSR